MGGFGITPMFDGHTQVQLVVRFSAVEFSPEAVDDEEEEEDEDGEKDAIIALFSPPLSSLSSSSSSSSKFGWTGANWVPFAVWWIRSGVGGPVSSAVGIIQFLYCP